MTRISDYKGEWFNMWYEDKKSILSTMIQNMVDDLSAGYDLMGNCIKRQQKEIDAYRIQMENEIDMFKTMEDNAVDRWCFYDMKKRGAID